MNFGVAKGVIHRITVLVRDDEGEFHFLVIGWKFILGFEPDAGGTDVSDYAGPTYPLHNQIGFEPGSLATIRSLVQIGVVFSGPNSKQGKKRPKQPRQFLPPQEFLDFILGTFFIGFAENSPVLATGSSN